MRNHKDSLQNPSQIYKTLKCGKLG